MRITWRGGLGRRMKSCKLDKFLESTAYCSSVHFRLEIIFELVISIFLFREEERYILEQKGTYWSTKAGPSIVAFIFGL